MPSLDRSPRGLHTKIDHSSFPDKRILSVGGRKITVSATYLAVRSTLFKQLFYSSDRISHKEFSVSADPDVFEDILDTIYPNQKRTGRPTSEIIPRINLAVALKFVDLSCHLIKSAEKSLSSADFALLLTNLDKLKELRYSTLLYEKYDTLKDFVARCGSEGFNAPEAVRRHAIQYYSDKREGVQTSALVVDRLRTVERKYPDTRTVSVQGQLFEVSSTILSIHSAWLKKFFADKDKENKALELQHLSSADVFLKFVDAAYGRELDVLEITPDLLTACVKYGSVALHDSFLKILNDAYSNIDGDAESGIHSAAVLLHHAQNRGKLNNATLNAYTSRIPAAHLGQFLSRLDPFLGIQIESVMA